MLPTKVSLEDLRFRRDLAVRDGDMELAMACAIAIDKNEPNKMKTEQQRIAIAEACGWRPGGKGTTWGDGQTFGVPPGGDDWHWQNTPDYLNDLNAMHEAEKALDPLGRDGAYEYWLRTVCHIPERESANGRYFYRATAAQRAEAFLRALNLWKE